LEFNVPFQHKYGYIRDETKVKSPKSSLFGFVEQFLNRLSTNPTKQISERFPGDILTKL